MTFRGVLGTFAAATALALVPASATFAYTGPEDEEVIVTETNPEPGEPFTTIVEAGVESPEATLTVTSEEGISDDAIEIAGTQSMTKATAGGAAEFSVTLYAEGNYTLTGLDANGNVVGEAAVVVGDGVPGEDGAEDGDAEAGAGAGGDDSFGAAGGLGDTGADAGTAMLGGAGALLLVGGGALLFARRRKATLA